MVRIDRAETEAQLDGVRGLIREFFAFAQTIDPHARTGPAFQALESELAGLPGPFAPPDGVFLLATVDGQPAGCGAIKRFDDGSCEIKRMFVRPAFRGQKLGDAILDGLTAEARELGYRRMVLSTLYLLTAAHRMYYKAGFADHEPWFEPPAEMKGQILFMARDL